MVATPAQNKPPFVHNFGLLFMRHIKEDLWTVLKQNPINASSSNNAKIEQKYSVVFGHPNHDEAKKVFESLGGKYPYKLRKSTYNIPIYDNAEEFLKEESKLVAMNALQSMPEKTRDALRIYFYEQFIRELDD